MRLRGSCAVLILAGAISTGLAENARQLRVGLYSDLKCTDEKSREAVWKVISSTPDFRADRISSETVANGDLNNFDVVIFPGGTGNGQAKSIGADGGRAIERFVAGGKGLIAICAGGYLVVEGWNPLTKSIELLNAESWDDEHWARGEQFISVKVSGVDDASSSHTMWFENGPIFVPGKMAYMPAYTSLVKYVSDLAPKGAPHGLMTGRDAVIASNFGKGRVVAFGPHPELSPGLHHWLTNAIRWTASQDGSTTISPGIVLEGKSE
jgi:glutamine amidotransferase-like uncharacterized protein